MAKSFKVRDSKTKSSFELDEICLFIFLFFLNFSKFLSSERRIYTFPVPLRDERRVILNQFHPQIRSPSDIPFDGELHEADDCRQRSHYPAKLKPSY